MKTNIELTESSEDILSDFVKMSRPRKFKTKDEKINAALECLNKFMKHLDSRTILEVGDLDRNNIKH